MTISSKTTQQAYQLNKGGMRARMAILRMIAADSVNNFNPQTRLNPGDWKRARSYTMGNWQNAYMSGLHQGSDSWHTHDGEQFRGERDAASILGNHRAAGYYTDTDYNEKAIGIVGRLTHGRFVAGYRWTSNDERVYYPRVFDDEDDAARMADEHACAFAQSAYEDVQKWDEARKIEIDIDDALIRLRECLAMRHNVRMHYVRDEARELCETVRTMREQLTTDYADYL